MVPGLGHWRRLQHTRWTPSLASFIAACAPTDSDTPLPDAWVQSSGGRGAAAPGVAGLFIRRLRAWSRSRSRSSELSGFAKSYLVHFLRDDDTKERPHACDGRSAHADKSSHARWAFGEPLCERNGGREPELIMQKRRQRWSDRFRNFARALRVCAVIALSAGCGTHHDNAPDTPDAEALPECVAYQAALARCSGRDVDIVPRMRAHMNSDADRAYIKKLCAENLDRISRSCR